MTSEEIRKSITEDCLSQIEVEGRKITGNEKIVWSDGFYAGYIKGIEYATALVDEKFKTTLPSKGEEHDK